MGTQLQLDDSGIRQAFAAASSDGALLTDDALEMLEVALDKGTISRRELKDLAQILRGSAVSPGARQEIERFIRRRRRQAAPRQNVQQLSDTTAIVSALREYADYLDFRNPVTGIGYSARHYLIVADLIESGDIAVKEFDYGLGRDREAVQANRHGALYDLYHNVFWLERCAGIKRLRYIVHEATHAIQDFTNLAIVHKHAEADAFVAGAIAAYHAAQRTESTLDGEPAIERALNPRGVIRAAAMAAVKAHKRNGGGSGELDQSHYEKLVSAIENDAGYRRVADRPFTQARSAQVSDEQEIKRWRTIGRRHWLANRRASLRLSSA